MDSSDFERRPNPPGWVPPKAPYNPYDPTDVRPAKGYPSEYTTPGIKKKFTGKVAKDTTDFSRMRIDMKRLEYFPKPVSELYPGRHKVLRRVEHMTRFDKGAIFTGKFAIYSFLIFGIFFYRWNDYDHVLAGFRRAQLRVKGFILGELSDEDYNDLFPQNLPIPQRVLTNEYYEQLQESEQVANTKPIEDNEFARERYAVKHISQAQHYLQMEEVKRLKEQDLRNKQLLSSIQQADTVQSNQSSKKSFWKFWQ